MPTAPRLFTTAMNRTREMVASRPLVDALAAAVVAIGIVLLIPIKVLAGKYSTLEVALALLAAAVIIVVSRRDIRWVPAPTLFVALVVLMVASTLWSSASWYTLRDSLASLALACAAFLLVSATGLRPIIHGVVAAGVVILVGTGVMWLLDPGSIFYHDGEAIQGVYNNRSVFGIAMVQCLPAVLSLAPRSRGGQVIKWAVFVAFFGAILLSRSQTSIIAAVVVVIVALVLAVSRASRIWAHISLGVIAGGAAVALFNGSRVLSFLGKSETLSGRSGMWEALLELSRSGPLIGFGFLHEWPGGSAQSDAVAKATGYQMIHGHNELLSWLTALGVAGLLLVVGLYVLVYVFGAKGFTRGHAGALWVILTMVMLNMRGLAELSETNPQGWFVFALAIFGASSFAIPSSLPRWARWVFISGRAPHGAEGKGRAQEGPVRDPQAAHE